MATTSRIYTYSATFHGLIILLALLFCSDGCLNQPPKEEIIPMEFLVVTEENAADVLAEEPNDVAEPELPPEPPAPDPLPPEPDPLPELPPEPEPIPAPLPEPPKPTPPPKPKAEPKKAEPKKETKKAEKKPEKPKNALKKPIEIKKGKRVGPVITGKKDRTKAATEKALSADEIAKMLAAGARPGSKNQTPKNEASRCYGIIQRIFEEACNRYGLETPPTGNAPQIAITFDMTGRVTNVKIAQGSGNRAYDNQVLQACRQVRHVSGLSQGFLKDYRTVTLRLNID